MRKMQSNSAALTGLDFVFGSVPGAASSFRGLTAGLCSCGTFSAFCPYRAEKTEVRDEKT